MPEFIFHVSIMLLVIIAFIYIIIRFPTNWKKTVEKITERYLKVRQDNPDFTDKQVFFEVLDVRYPADNPLTKELNKIKDRIKIKIDKEIKSQKKAGSNVLNKYNLPTLVYCCLVIEKDQLLSKKKMKDIKNLISTIEEEIRKLGAEQYI